jgi:hypothetical protein
MAALGTALEMREHAKRLTSGSFHLIDRFRHAAFYFASGLVDLTFGLHSLVAGQSTGGFFNAPFGFVHFACHDFNLPKGSCHKSKDKAPTRHMPCQSGD